MAELNDVKIGYPQPDARVVRKYHHGSLLAVLVDTAARLAAERGYESVSLREVARQAGVSQAAPYHYFRNKSALVAAVAEAGFQLLDAAQEAALRHAPDDPVQRLATFSASYVRFALDRPHYFKVMFRPHLAQHGEYPALSEVAKQSFERLVEIVRAARLASDQDDADPSVAATLIWAVPHGLALLFVEGPLATKTTPRALEDLARAAMPALAAASLDEIEPEPHWGV